MRVLLGLRDAHLPEPGVADHLAEHQFEFLGGEGDIAGEVAVVLGQRDVVGVRAGDAVEAIEVRVEECLGELAAAVGAEVEPQDDVAVVDALGSGIAEDHRQEELIGLVGCVFGGDRLRREDVLWLADAVYDRVPGELVAVPALVAIHRVVAPDDGDDFRAELGEPVLAVVEVVFAAGR